MKRYLKTNVMLLSMIGFFIYCIIPEAFAQNYSCGDFEDQMLIQNGYDPELLRQQTELQIQSWLNSDNINNRQVVVIPIVVHVVYHVAAENISDATIFSQIDFLNKDFRRLNVDAINTPSAFQAIAADVMIEFCFADLDTNGNPTTGITRTYTDTVVFQDTFLGNNQFYRSTTGGVDAWDPTKYLNIYVINRGYFAGTSSSPASHGQIWDVIGMDYPYFNADHALSHEVGHYFGLYHVFGGTSGVVSCGDDYVSDTPVQDYNQICPSYPKFSCGHTDTSDMFMNYMDYTPTTCKNLFTVGQSNRMNAALNTQRASLLTSSQCPYIGVEESIKNEFNLFPNPASDYLILNAGENYGENISISIFNVTGQMIESKKYSNAGNIMIGLEDWASGIYFLKIDDGAKSMTRKFIKK